MTPNDNQTEETLFVAVMGATGTGKSSFINLSSDSAMMEVGNSLMPCTQVIQESAPFELDGRPVQLIDTPGFDAAFISQVEVLKQIGEFLEKIYHQGRRLNGVIYLHRITDVRSTGTSQRAFRTFRKICGEGWESRVTIVTTMWDEIAPNDLTEERRELLERRDGELKNDDALFKQVLARGAEMFRHNGSVESAHKILRAAIDHLPAAPLHMQYQIAVDHMGFLQTDAGLDLQEQLIAGAATHQAIIDKIIARRAALREGYDEEYGTHSAALAQLDARLGEAQAGLHDVEDAQRAIADALEVLNRRNTRHGASSFAGNGHGNTRYRKFTTARLTGEVTRGMYWRLGLVRGVMSRALGYLRKRRGERLN